METVDISKSEKKKLLIAVVQTQDCDIAVDSLNNEGYSVTRLPSVGAFLGRRSATLLIVVPDENQPKAMELLKNTCHKRVAFIAVPIENAPLPMPAPTPVSVGGVSLFALDIEQFEEF
ncbi:MAG: cyclic-di-AMP receptor [Anaerolineaceae bacterium]|nr:cyclic-di-AMP receptor [Anaerolineaceae bacterium]